MLRSRAVTEGVGFKNGNKAHGTKLIFIDISKAYCHSRARRRILIKLPAGDEEPGMCGLLNKSLQGTRDAALNWEYKYSEFLESIGFT